jgi:iron complex transport system substrate-binding protein
MLRFIFVLAISFVSASPAGATEIHTARGIVDIATLPTKIAVFDIAALDTLNRLGIKPSGIPNKLYLRHLEHLQSDAEVVGDIFEPDLEALSALDPDLIILGGRSSTRVEATAQVAPTIDMTMDGDDLVNQAKARLMEYGRLFDREAAARTIASALDDQIDATHEAAAGKGRVLIIMTNGPKITAYGPGSRFGWVHATLGLEPAVSDVQSATHGEAVSFEFIHRANPDWILVVDRAAAIGSGEQGARATLDNELVAATTAWKKEQIVFLPAADFYIAAGGIQATERVMKTLEDAFITAR